MAELATTPKTPTKVAPLRAHSISEKQIAAIVEGAPPLAPGQTAAQAAYGAARVQYAAASGSYGAQSEKAYPAQRRLMLAESALLRDTADRIHANPDLMARFSDLAKDASRPSHNPMERAATIAAALNAQLLPVAPVKVSRPVPAAAVPANTVERVQQVAARHSAEQAVENAAPTVRRNVPEMSNRQILSEVSNLHNAFQQLSARYEKAGTLEERAALRDQMRPIVNREGELREGYLGRITQEIRRDGATPRVGESRRILEPRIDVADLAVAR